MSEEIPLAEVLKGVVRPSDAPRSGLYDTGIDVEIAPLVHALNAAGFVTSGSCAGGEGHGPWEKGDGAYVGLAVRGSDGLRRFVRLLNELDRRHGLLLSVGLNWADDVATSTFRDDGDWISISIKILEDDDRAHWLSVLAQSVTELTMNEDLADALRNMMCLNCGLKIEEDTPVFIRNGQVLHVPGSAYCKYCKRCDGPCLKPRDHQ